MADNNEKLERLRRQVQEAAELDAKRILDEADKNSDAIVEAEKARIAKEHDSIMRSAVSKFESDERKRVSKAVYAANRKVLLHRNALVGDFFNEISGELRAFASSGKYEKYLQRCIDQASEQQELTQDIQTCCRPEDVKLVEKLIGGRTKVTADKMIKFGGLMFRVPSKGIYIDLTMDSAFEAERAAFSANALMQL